MTAAEGTAPAYTDTRWPWRLTVTYKDGAIRTDDYSSDFGPEGSGGPLGYARHLSQQPNVERVGVTTAFADGQQVAGEPADMIIRWDEVRTGDLVLTYQGELEAATVMPQGNAWQPEGCVSVMIGGSWYTPRKDRLTAFRRPSAEGTEAR